MHWAWAEAGCGYVHMYPCVIWKGTQRNVGAPIFHHHRVAENPLAVFFTNSKETAAYLTSPSRHSRCKVASLFINLMKVVFASNKAT